MSAQSSLSDSFILTDEADSPCQLQKGRLSRWRRLNFPPVWRSIMRKVEFQHPRWLHSAYAVPVRAGLPMLVVWCVELNTLKWNFEMFYWVLSSSGGLSCERSFIFILPLLFRAEKFENRLRLHLDEPRKVRLRKLVGVWTLYRELSRILISISPRSGKVRATGSMKCQSQFNSC